MGRGGHFAARPSLRNHSWGVFQCGRQGDEIRSLLRWDSNKRRAFVELLHGPWPARHGIGTAFSSMRATRTGDIAPIEGVTSTVSSTLPSIASIALEDFGYQQQEAGFELTSAVERQIHLEQRRLAGEPQLSGRCVKHRNLGCGTLGCGAAIRGRLAGASACRCGLPPLAASGTADDLGFLRGLEPG